MKLRKTVISLFVTPLLIGCSNEISLDFQTPSVDVDSISLGDLKRDSTTGEIASEGDNVFFDFYEVSDFHGAVNYSVDDRTIGLAKMADYFSKKRSLNPGGTVILSSGDMYQGSAESNLTHGYVVNYSMNVMGFESMTLGNHEFDWTIDWLKKNQSLEVEGHKITYLGANIFDKASGQLLDFLKPSLVIERGDYKVGIVGTMGDGANKSIMKSLVESVEFKPELEIAKAEAARLKVEEGCDIVVWSSHKDVKELTQYGSVKASGIDVVFGGHTHKNSPGADEPTTYLDGVPYLETENYGRGISHARVTLNKTSKEIVDVVGNTQANPYTTPDLVEHPEVKKIVDTYNTYIDPIKSKVIGSTDGELEVTDSFTLTNLCVDTMSLAAKKWAKDNGDVKIVAAFHNAKGGIRDVIKAGDITFGNVYKSFPFDNEICVIKVKGKNLKAYLNSNTVNGYGIWIDTEAVPTRDAIDVNADYYFTTTDFMATSDKFVFKLNEEDLIRTGYVVRDVVAARIESQGKIKKADFTREHAQFNVPEKY